MMRCWNRMGRSLHFGWAHAVRRGGVVGRVKAQGRRLALGVLLSLLAGSGAVSAQEDAWFEGVDEGASAAFRRGDANLDGLLSLADVFTILRFSFLNAPLHCLDAADVDDSGQIDPTDALFLFEAVFSRRRTPPEPFLAMGVDPTQDRLSCERSPVVVLGLAAGGAEVAGVRALDDLGIQDPGADIGGVCRGPDGEGADLDFIHSLGRIIAQPGQDGIRVPIRLSTAGGGIEGLTLSVYAPPEQIFLEDIVVVDEDTAVHSFLASGQGWANTFRSMLNEGFLASTVALSTRPPFATLAPIPYPGETVAFLEFSVAPDVPVGTEIGIDFRRTPSENGLPPIRTEISRSGSSEIHGTCGLVVEIVSQDELFVRADANRDWRVDLSDAVAILGTVFTSSHAGAACLDAADVDDDGAIRVTDALHLLNFLFRSGPSPAIPYPLAGRDTAVTDSLGCLAPENG